MIKRGIATFTLDYGKCPRWLFQRMVKLGREVTYIICQEYGPDEFVRRIADPVWFQSLGTVLAFDWNASGLTTTLTAALKEAIRGHELDFGIYICGGKGKTSRKTPDEIKHWSERTDLTLTQCNNLVYNSKMAAKVDSALVQDGFQIYHHAFFFTKSGSWSVVQQGMNKTNKSARRYHWYSDNIDNMVCEPHTGIASQVKSPTLNLTSKNSSATRDLSVDLIDGGYKSLIRDIQIIRKHSSSLSKTITIAPGLHRSRIDLQALTEQQLGSTVVKHDKQLTLLELYDKDFHTHPVVTEDFSKSKYLDKILYKLCDRKPTSYEKLLAIKGVGPKTIRALSLVSELIYGAKPSYEDPARYSFAHGGKDAIPYPVDKKTYDDSIEFFRKIITKINLSRNERVKIQNLLTT